MSDETDGKFACLGYVTLYNLVRNWYVIGFKPKPIWMKKCKERAYLTFEEVDSLILQIGSKPYLEQAKIKL